MKKRRTDYGTLCIGGKEAIFEEAVELAAGELKKSGRSELTWALTGGSTPAEFYRDCVSNRKIPGDLLEASRWFTSDERMAPLESDESNFGNAARVLLDPLRVPAEKRFPWPVERAPEEAANSFEVMWKAVFSASRCFDVCVLGMGDDCHTASIFPESPLIAEPVSRFFSEVEVPGKGWRLTVTPYGLERCGLIVVMVVGRKKAGPLKAVFDESPDPRQRPIQLLRAHAARTVWLVDEDAGSELAG